jgi:hypothetical protein
VLVLGVVKEFQALQMFVQAHEVPILAFESLAPAEQVAAELNVEQGRES